MIKIEPQNNRVLVEPVSEKVTQGGIILPGNDKDKPEKGIVIAQPEGCPKQYMGKTIIFNKYTALPYKEDDKNYLLVKLEDIYAVYI